MESLLYDVMLDALEKARGVCVGERFFALVYWIREMAVTARNQGLFALEAATMDAPQEIGLYRESQWVAGLVMDGTDPETVRELSANRYWASNFQGEDALLYYTLIFGFLNIQSGVNPYRLDFILIGWLSSLPGETFYQYERYSLRMDAPKVAAQEKILLNHNPVFENQEMMAAQKLLEEKILQMDREMLIHMLCQEIDHIDLVIALYGLSLAAKQKLFSVMSEEKVYAFAAIWAGWKEGNDSLRISENTVQEALERLLAAFEKRKLPVRRYEHVWGIYIRDAFVSGFAAGV